MPSPSKNISPKEMPQTPQLPQLLSGNAALAHALRFAKVKALTSYPGSPATEIVETAKKVSPHTFCHWAANEKVALEMAVGACYAGQRAVCSMKHVGLNVAADPLMTFSYTGVNAGALIVTADDPNLYSSQNEQDNRNYARFAKIPMLEPSDAQEVFDFTLLGLEISEAFCCPVLLRLTMRVCHSHSLVTLSPPAWLAAEKKLLPPPTLSPHFPAGQDRFVMLPAIARERHRVVEKRLLRLEAFSNQTCLNRLEKPASASLQKYPPPPLLVTAGVSYLYAKESFPTLPLFKAGFSYPFPSRTIKQLTQSAAFKKIKEIICVEELDPFIENELLIQETRGLRKRHPDFYCGELSPRRVKNLVEKNQEQPIVSCNQDAPPNPPKLCSGCPHLTISGLLRELVETHQAWVSGDIGCYTLAALPPYRALHSVLDMGASLPIALGLSLAEKKPEKKRPLLAVIGDSTFLHSGLTGLLDAAHLQSNLTICLLDNHTTAMTGQQAHSGHHLEKDQRQVDYLQLAKAMGVKNLYQVDPYSPAHCRLALHKSLAEPGVSLVVFKRACALLAPPPSPFKPAEVQENCVRCGACLEVGCPSITFHSALGRPKVDEATCIGCGVCYDSCHYSALKEKSETPLSLADLLVEQ